MKWYCNKAYIPISGAEMVIRTTSKRDYERYFIASLEHHGNRESLEDWYMANAAHHDLKFEDYKVTHFCPLDPVVQDETLVTLEP